MNERYMSALFLVVATYGFVFSCSERLIQVLTRMPWLVSVCQASSQQICFQGALRVPPSPFGNSMITFSYDSRPQKSFRSCCRILKDIPLLTMLFSLPMSHLLRNRKFGMFAIREVLDAMVLKRIFNSKYLPSSISI